MVSNLQWNASIVRHAPATVIDDAPASGIVALFGQQLSLPATAHSLGAVCVLVCGPTLASIGARRAVVMNFVCCFPFAVASSSKSVRWGFRRVNNQEKKDAANADRRAPWINRPTMLHRGRKCCQNLTWSRVEGTWSGKRVSLLVDAKSGLGSIVGDVHPPAGIVDRAGGRALLW